MRPAARAWTTSAPALAVDVPRAFVEARAAERSALGVGEDESVRASRIGSEVCGDCIDHRLWQRDFPLRGLGLEVPECRGSTADGDELSVNGHGPPHEVDTVQRESEDLALPEPGACRRDDKCPVTVRDYVSEAQHDLGREGHDLLLAGLGCRNRDRGARCDLAVTHRRCQYG